jgi:hypothetical protein
MPVQEIFVVRCYRTFPILLTCRLPPVFIGKANTAYKAKAHLLTIILHRLYEAILLWASETN